MKPILVNKTMICPICKKEGKKSTVQTGGIMSTLVGYTSWYDENGSLHHHDDNSRTTVGFCSNNHKFAYRFKNICWCGWKGKDEQYSFEEELSLDEREAIYFAINPEKAMKKNHEFFDKHNIPKTKTVTE